jgi:hypothetical protein
MQSAGCAAYSRVELTPGCISLPGPSPAGEVVAGEADVVAVAVPVVVGDGVALFPRRGGPSGDANLEGRRARSRWVWPRSRDHLAPPASPGKTVRGFERTIVIRWSLVVTGFQGPDGATIAGGSYVADKETPVRAAIRDERTAGSCLPLELERRYRARDDFERE